MRVAGGRDATFPSSAIAGVWPGSQLAGRGIGGRAGVLDPHDSRKVDGNGASGGRVSA